LSDSNPSIVNYFITSTDIVEITKRARPDLETLRGARIFITGGTGYIGRWLLESICYANRNLDLKLKAVILSRRPDIFTSKHPHLAGDPALTLVQGDVRDFTGLEGEFSHLIHAATDVVASSTPLDMFDVTVTGTKRVLEFALQHGVSKALLLSSGAVYGRFPSDIARISEDYRGAPDVGAPSAAYGLGKISTEWLGNAYAEQYGFSCMAARIFAQIGPYLELDAQFAAGNFIRDALLGQQLVIKGDGKSIRTYMYGTDLVVWLLAILARGDSGRAYNVGSEHEVSILELAEIVIQTLNLDTCNIRVLGHSAPGAAPDRYVPDTHRARSELNVSLMVPCQDAIRRTIDWYRPHLTKIH
jgi:nucleoside-diphosphate-sugar epimerase